MWPHVYVDVEESMECFHEEMFGPVVTIVKAKDFDHAPAFSKCQSIWVIFGDIHK